MPIYIDHKVQALRELHHETLNLDRGLYSISELLSLQAQTILSGHKSGNSAVTFHLGSWCPSLIGQPADKIMSTPLSLDLARLTIAREYGYSDWNAVKTDGNIKLDTEFEQAVDWVITGEVAQLSGMFVEKPELATQVSQYPHSSTLFHYLAANGVESHRQIVPLNAIEVARALLEAGADVNAHANMYGGGSTTLGLWESSAHPANAGIQEAVSVVLREAGAR